MAAGVESVDIMWLRIPIDCTTDTKPGNLETVAPTKRYAFITEKWVSAFRHLFARADTRGLLGT